MKIRRTLCLVLAMVLTLSIAFPAATFADDLYADMIEEDYYYGPEEYADDLYFEDRLLLENEDYDDGLDMDFNDSFIEDTEDWLLFEDENTDAIQEVFDEENDYEGASDDVIYEEDITEKFELSDLDVFLTAALEVTGPEDVTVPADETASFQVTVSGGSAPYTYQWETLLVGKTKWQTTSLNGYNTDKHGYAELHGTGQLQKPSVPLRSHRRGRQECDERRGNPDHRHAGTPCGDRPRGRDRPG